MSSWSTNSEPDPLSGEIIGAAITVHRELGPGLLESAYSECLAVEFADRGLKFEREVFLPVTFKGRRVDCGYRMDFVVSQSVIVEIKAIERVLPVHEAQLLTYLRISGVRTGLLLNFNVPAMKQGIYRRVL